jgi:peptidoglycan-associated lipoprotein
MKPVYQFLCVGLVALALAGCGGQGGLIKKDAGDKGPAPVVEGGERAAGDAGDAGKDASATGTGAVGTFQGDPLDDPSSPLAKRTIYFEYDSADVLPEYREYINAHGDYLAANPDARVTVEGHTDERGSREYNVGLGERRARSVSRLLLFRGASSSQIGIVSFGEERPADYGHDETAWRQNRRVEIIYQGR